MTRQRGKTMQPGASGNPPRLFERGRTKESLAYEATREHASELRFIDSRLGKVEAVTDAIQSEIRTIRETQIKAEAADAAILEALTKAETQRAEATRRVSDAARQAELREMEQAKLLQSKKDSIMRNLIAFGGLVATAIALGSRSC